VAAARQALAARLPLPAQDPYAEEDDDEVVRRRG
jgi:hypothetical protein